MQHTPLYDTLYLHHPFTSNHRHGLLTPDPSDLFQGIKSDYIDSGDPYRFPSPLCLWHYGWSPSSLGPQDLLCFIASQVRPNALLFRYSSFNQGANQGSIYHWARDHRLHHKYSDTLLDPHSIEKGFFFAHIGWLLSKKSAQLVQEGRKIDMSDLKADWVITFQRRFNWLLTPLMCWIIPGNYSSYKALCFYQATQAGWLVCLCMANMPYVTLLHSTWFVNSVCHKFGSRPWNKNIAPTDNVWVSLLTNG
jgi:fatty-acid desaturase